MQENEEIEKEKKKKRLFLRAGLLSIGSFSSFLIMGAVVITAALIIFLSPIIKFTSLVNRITNTFTQKCFFCDVDDVEEKAQQRFYKKIQKIDNQYKRGVGMSPGNPSIQIDVALLISSAIIDRTMVGNINNINLDDVEDGDINLDEIESDSDNTDGSENADIWDDALDGDGILSLWKTSWYEAEGDPVSVVYENCGVDESDCHVKYVKFSTKKEPDHYSALRKLAKHMVKREVHWDIHSYDCSTKEESHTCWYTEDWFEYVLSTEKDDSAYTVATDEKPYVEYIYNPSSEEQVNGSVSSFVKYLISTYIPEKFPYAEQVSSDKHNATYNVLPNPNKVSKQVYLDAKKSMKNNMYYYKFMYDEIAKYISTQNQSMCSYGGSCEYAVDGATYSNLKVKLLQCGDETRGEPIEGEALVDFEKYIMGVVYAENAGGSFEALKAQAVAARSYALLRGKKMGTKYLQIYQENGQWILPIRNCTEDQVYCDPDQGCSAVRKPSASGAATTIYSGANKKGYTYKGPLSADSDIRKAVIETTGEVLMNGGSIVYTTYTDTTQNRFNSMANDGIEYNQILANVYGTGSDVKSSCDYSCGASGDFASWKQTDGTWKDVIIGSPGGSMGKIGCLVTSLAIQIARSGAAPFDDFNPGSFAMALNQIGAFGPGGALQGDHYVTSVAPNFYKDYSSANTGGIGSTQADKLAVIQKQLEDGCYPIVRVKGDGHFVAVDRVEGDSVYIFDPDPSNKTGMLWPFYDVGGTTLSSCWKRR